MADGLFLSGGVYYYQRRVPKDLADHPEFRGRKNLKRSLRTKDHRVAEANARIVAGEFEQAFRKARDEVEAASKPRYVGTMTPAEMDAFVGDAILNMNSVRELLDAGIELPIERPEEGRLIEWHAALKRMVMPDWLVDGLRDRLVEHLRTPRETTLASPPVTRREVAEFKAVAATVGLSKVKRHTIGDLVDAFVKDGDRVDLEDSTKGSYVTPIELLVDVFGRERRLDTISRLDVKDELRDSVLRFIPVYGKSASRWPEYEGWDYRRIAEDVRARLDDGEDIPLLAEPTIKKYLTAIGTIFGYAADHGMRDANMADGLYVRPKNAPDKPTRQAFPDASLAKIFPTAEWRPADDVDWMCILALLHGFRGNEAAQIGVADVLEQDGHWCISVTDEDWRKTKNGPSKRTVPVHPKLIELGYVDLARRRAKEGHPRVLATVPHGGDYCYGSIRDRIRERLDELKVRTPGVHVFHSFRHNFEIACKNCGVEERKGQALGGWSQGKGADKKYGLINGHGFEIPVLVPEIAKVRYRIPMFG